MRSTGSYGGGNVDDALHAGLFRRDWRLYVGRTDRCRLTSAAYWRSLPLACAALACAGHSTPVIEVPYTVPPPRANVFVNAPFVGLAPGTTGHAQAQVRDATGHILKDSVRWRSSHPEFVAVKPTGPGTADLFYLRPGRAVLTASAAGASASTILYTGPIPPAASLRVLPEQANIRPDDLIRLKAFPYDSLKQLKPSLWVRWSWSDSSRVHFFGVPDYGEIILAAVKTGCVRVTATLDSITATSLVKIGFPGNCTKEKSLRSPTH